MKFLISENQYFIINPAAALIQEGRVVNENADLSSFEIQDTLNPDIFDEKSKMIPEVRKTLLKIGEDFFKELGIDWIDYEDIILTGSLANYNWSRFSDVDLHITLPYGKVDGNSEVVDDLMWATKELWNLRHDLKIKDYDIELYAQNSENEEELVSGGVYSVLYDRWLVKPERIEVNFNEEDINRYYNDLDDEARAIVSDYKAGKTHGIPARIDDWKDKVRDLRKQGLKSGGEFASENIVFKALRRKGLFDKLNDINVDVYDNEHSIPLSGEEELARGGKEEEPPKKKKAEVEPPKPRKPKEDKGEFKYIIQGKKFKSVRDAAKVIKGDDGDLLPKSTIWYRIKSDSYGDYREV